MYEIKVLTVKLLRLLGEYLDLNQELAVPQTVTLPIELYLPFSEGVIRTLNNKYQKFRTYLLVNFRLIWIVRLELTWDISPTLPKRAPYSNFGISI
jgi:hypothetical protein